MDGDDLLREAISTLVDEVLTDPTINPDREIERIITVATSLFWTAYHERRQTQEDHNDAPETP
jgi:hypothetical protein